MLWRRIREERPTPTLICAGPLRLDLSEHRATLNDRDLELSPLLMRLLQILAERPRQLISRQQIKQELWPNSDRIDTHRRLNTAIRALRMILRDDAGTPQFIETVRSQGYRWIGSGSGQKRGARFGWNVLAVALLVSVAIGWTALALRKDQGSQEPLPLSLMRAQAALDGWRATPDSPHLTAADQAVAAALKATPSSPASHILKAQLALESLWDWNSAAQEYARALEFDPSNTDARLGLAWLKVNRGDEAGALADANQLMLSSVLAGDRRIELGWLFIRAGRPDLATVACPVATNNRNGLSCAHTALAAVGQFEQARTAAAHLMRITNASPELVQRIEHMPAEAAYRQFLIWRAHDFLQPDSFYFDRAQVLADAGFDTEALDNLERSVTIHEPLAVKITSSPAFMRLRTNPRYQALVRTVGAVTTRVP